MSLSASGQVMWLDWYAGGMVVLIAMLDHQPDSAQPVFSTLKKDICQTNRQVLEVTLCGEADSPLLDFLNQLTTLHNSCYTDCSDLCQAAGLTLRENSVTPL